MVQILRDCVKDTRPAIDNMLQTLSGNQSGGLDLEASRESLEELLDRTIRCAELNEQHQQSLILLSLSPQDKPHSLSYCAADRLETGPSRCEEVHLKRLEKGLQELDAPEACTQTPSLMLQRVGQGSPSHFSLARVAQTHAAKPGTRKYRGFHQPALLPIPTEVLEHGCSDHPERGGDDILGLANMDASPRRATFAQVGRSASAVISSLHDRVQQQCSGVSGRNLQFQWNRQFVITQGTQAGAPTDHTVLEDLSSMRMHGELDLGQLT